jgi:putative acetyltransferase
VLPEIQLREARDEDAEGLIALIGAVFSEYPGCVLDVEGELPELRHIATSFRAWSGQFWVATRGERLVGCVGWTPTCAPEGIELRKLYVAQHERERGLGGRLCTLVEEAAEARGARFIELWSDTRFETAHRFYARRGYRQGPTTRALHDLSNTVEYYFRRESRLASASER